MGRRKADVTWPHQARRIEAVEREAEREDGTGNARHGWWVQPTARGDQELRWRIPLSPLMALRALGSLREAFDRHEREWVLTARASGASWERVAWALGISRQAAQKRHPMVDIVLAEMPLEER